MSKRLKLQKILEDTLGSRNVYFQPPSTVKMGYPCIVYSRTEVNFNTRFANGSIYIYRRAYKLIYIDPNPDSDVIDKLVHLPYCHYETHYKADNLNHDAFTLFY
jgi:hypothetical protein